MEVLIIGVILLIMGVLVFIGFVIGKSYASLKYGAKIDNYKARLNYKDDRIFDLQKKLKREMEKNYARKNN